MSNTPSDEELDSVLCHHWPAFSMQAVLVRMWLRDAMRAALAKWGTPQQEAQKPTEVPYQKMTNEIDLILSDPDTDLSIGAKRSLLWMRTWVSVPLFTAPQQEAQEPVAWRYNRLGSCVNPWFKEAGREADDLRVGRWDTIAGLYMKPSENHVDWTPLYAAPQPAPAPLSEREEIAMIDAAMVEMANIVPPLRRSECARLIRAALAAQGGK